MTIEEKAQKFDELVAILKQIFPGGGNINFHGKLIDEVNNIVNPDNDWKFYNGGDITIGK